MKIMIVKLVASLLVAEVAFSVGEWLRRRVHGSNEVSRKLVHIIHGLLIASWPFVLGETWGYHLVIALEVLFLISVVAAKQLHIFKWMWMVGRKSWGEVLYPIGIIAAAMLAENRWVFLAAVLSLAVADAVAALVGKRFGKNNTYRILGQTKSVVGSAAFLVAALGIVSIVAVYGPGLHLESVMGTVVGISLILMAVENAGVYGMDNLTLPLASVLLLNMLY